MLTEAKARKFVGKAMDCKVAQDDIIEYKKHSNICWELRVNTIKKMQLLCEVIEWCRRKGPMKEFPSSKSILHMPLTKVIICKNLETGKNILRRRSKLQAEQIDNFQIEINNIKIDNEDWYVFAN